MEKYIDGEGESSTSTGRGVKRKADVLPLTSASDLNSSSNSIFKPTVGSTPNGAAPETGATAVLGVSTIEKSSR